jgi:DNA mismatch repair protein MutL
MAGKIKVLPERLSTKIAAGEVIERPASVVKELLENSIDAGATEISVTVAEGGRRLIKVVDNGSGLSREDAALAILRHATSKVSNEEDLYKITTMGFRGEALPSIASVARLTIRTKLRGGVVGTCVRVEGGKAEPEVLDEGCREGTTVEVRDLFYNTPARSKFLRSATTEWGRILDVFKRTAIACNGIRFRLVHGSGRPIETRAGGLAERVSDIFGRSILKELKEVKCGSIEVRGEVTGLVGNPALSSPTAKWLFTYVNGRWIRDRGINRAIADAYSGTMESGRYPFAIINLKVPFDEVDVNVHPAKTEVRFRRPAFTFDIIKAAVRGAIGSGSYFFEKGSEISPALSPADVPFRASSTLSVPEVPSRGFTKGRERLPFKAREVQSSYTEGVSPGGLKLSPKGEGVVNPEFLEMEMVGQIWGEFIVAQAATGSEFFIIDQHGAAERTRFERLKRHFYNTSSVSSQYLLVPERIETAPHERDVLNEAMPVLTRLGFEIIPFGPSIKQGGETFVIKAAPDMLEGRALGRLVKDLVEELTELNRSSKIEDRIDEVLMRIACHSVIRGPRALEKEEAKALFLDLARTDLAGHCPHGRPVLKSFTREEVEAMFKRR